MGVGDKVKWAISIKPEGMDYAEWQASSDRVWTTPVISDTLLTKTQDESVNFGSIFSFSSAYDKAGTSFTISASGEDKDLLEGLFFRVNYFVYASDGLIYTGSSGFIDNKTHSYTINNVNAGDKVAWSINISPDDFTWEGFRGYNVTNTVQYTEESYAVVGNDFFNLFKIVTKYENNELKLSRDEAFTVKYIRYNAAGKPINAAGNPIVAGEIVEFTETAASLVGGKYVVTIDYLDADYRVDWRMQDGGSSDWSELISTDIDKSVDIDILKSAQFKTNFSKNASKVNLEITLEDDSLFADSLLVGTYLELEIVNVVVVDGKDVETVTKFDPISILTNSSIIKEGYTVNVLAGSVMIEGIYPNGYARWKISNPNAGIDNDDTTTLVKSPIESKVVFVENHRDPEKTITVDLVFTYGEDRSVHLNVSSAALKATEGAIRYRYLKEGLSTYTTGVQEFSKDSGGLDFTGLVFGRDFEWEISTVKGTGLGSEGGWVWHHDAVNDPRIETTVIKISDEELFFIGTEELVLTPKFDPDGQELVLTFADLTVDLDKYLFKSNQVILDEGANTIGSRIVTLVVDNITKTVTISGMEFADIISIADKPDNWDTMSIPAKNRIRDLNIWEEVFESVVTSDSFVTGHSSIIVESKFARGATGLELTLTPIGDTLHHQYYEISYKIDSGVEQFSGSLAPTDNGFTIESIGAGASVEWRIRTSSDGEVWEGWDDWNTDLSIITSDSNNIETSELYVATPTTTKALVQLFTSEYDYSLKGLLLNSDLDKLPVGGSFHVEYSVFDVNGQIKKKLIGDDGIYTASPDSNGNYVLNEVEVGLGEKVIWEVVMTYPGADDVRGTEVVAQIDTVMMSAGTPVAVNPDDPGTGNTSAISKLTWGRAISDNPIVEYRVEYFESEIILGAGDITARFNSGNVYVKDTTSNEVVASSLIDQSYVYWRVQAVDTESNASAWSEGESFRVFVGDDGKPYFEEGSNKDAATMFYSEDRTDAYNVKFNATFSWKAANDDKSGVKYYLVEYKLRDQAWDEAERTTVLDDGRANPAGDLYAYNQNFENIPGGLYDYRITAVDYVGNQSELTAPGTTGSFGASDLAPPVGAFTKLNTPLVSAEWDVREVKTEERVFNKETGKYEIIVHTTTVRELISAKVDFTWVDNYTDPSGVRYKIEFSDSVNFNSGKTYQFETHSASQSYSIGNWLPTQPVGIFAGMDTVYWRLMATDTIGNDTGIPSSHGSFNFIDPVTKIAIKHEKNPEKPYSLKITQTQTDYKYDGSVDYAWSVINADLGIGYYDLVFTCHENAAYSYTYRGDYGSIIPDDPTATGPGYSYIYSDRKFEDGTYSWTVTTYNANNQATTSDIYQFVVDATRPTTVVGLKTVALVKDVYFEWTASSDDFGIKDYQLRFRKLGEADWQTRVDIDDNKYTLLKIGNGTYEYIVYAFDENGNRSLVSDETKTFTVDASKDLADDIWNAKESGNKTFENTIGISDIADYFYFDALRAGKTTLSITGLDSVFNPGTTGSGIVISIYSGKGTTKANTDVKLVNWYWVTGDTNIDIYLKQLDAGQHYYVGITPGNADEALKYKLAHNHELFNTNNKDDDWTKLDPLNVGAYELTVGADGTGKLVDKDNNEGDWVGFGDAVDYRKLDLTYSGSYNFTISGLTGWASMTVYVAYDYWGAGGASNALWAIGTITVNSDASIKKLLLDTRNEYYLQVYAPYHEWGMHNADYKVDVTGTVFNEPGINNADDIWNTMDASIYKLDIVDDGSGTNTATGALINEWVGYSDAVDYRKLNLTSSGNYSFTISDLDSWASMTVYVAYDYWGAGGANNALWALGTVTIGSGSGLIDNLVLDANNEYYLKVDAPYHDYGIYNTKYKVDVTGKTFDHVGVDENDNDWTNLDPLGTGAYELVIDGGGNGSLENKNGTAGDWVGYVDAVDYRKLNLTYSGSYAFVISDTTSWVSMTVYLAYDYWGAGGTNNALWSLGTITIGSDDGSINNLLLDVSNDYYLKVDAPYYEYGIYNTEYKVDVTASELFDKPGVNNADDIWNTMDASIYKLDIIDDGTGTSTAIALLDNEWVGFSDAVDYRKLNLTSSGSYDFKISDATSWVSMTVYLAYDYWGAGGANNALWSLGTVTIGSGTGSINNLLLDASKDYYLKVNAPYHDYGIYNTEYKVEVTGNTANNADDNWDDIGVQILTVGDPKIEDWVGFKDARDWFRFNIGTTGDYKLDLELDMAQYANMKLYKVNGDNSRGNEVALDANNVALLADGNYALEISSLDEGQGGWNTGYQLGLTTV